MTIPIRRKRYSGTHPKRFAEKYKELRGDEETLKKVRESGKTPAGSHVPVLLEETLRELRLKPGASGVDATLGGGGHSRALLREIGPEGRLLALDVDPVELKKTEATLRTEGHGPDRLVTWRGNFAGVAKALTDNAWNGVDFLLADLGVSSMQIDDPARGFSFKNDGPLDLRMNPARGIPASDWLHAAAVEEVTAALADGGDEPRAGKIAEAIAGRHVASTAALRRELEAVAPERDAKDTVTRVFQALRIAVNDEFGALEALLRQLPYILHPGARAAFITFHSGEDRRVKHAFRDGKESGVYAFVSDQVLRPSAAEIHANPRARSAKLRVCERSAFAL